MQTIKLDRRHLVLNVRPEILVALALQNAIHHNKNYLQQNPGAVAMIRSLELTEEDLGEDIIRAMSDVGRFDKVTTDRVASAEKYIRNTAMFLYPTGRAWGVYIDCCIANIKPEVFTPEQHEIFGNGERVKPLMTLEGVTDFINALVRADVQIDEQTKRTLAQLVLDNVASFGGVDNNVFSAILPSAINSHGKLTQQTFVQTFRPLRTEGAKTQQEVPQSVRQTASEYQETVHGYRNGTQNGDGKRGRQARA